MWLWIRCRGRRGKARKDSVCLGRAGRLYPVDQRRNAVADLVDPL